MEAPVLLAGLNEVGLSWQQEKIEAYITQMLPALNARLAPHERISGIFLVRKEWTIENELLTPTMKIIRNALVKRYESMVLAMPKDAIVTWE